MWFSTYSIRKKLTQVEKIIPIPIKILGISPSELPLKIKNKPNKPIIIGNAKSGFNSSSIWSAYQIQNSQCSNADGLMLKIGLTKDFMKMFIMLVLIRI